MFWQAVPMEKNVADQNLHKVLHTQLLGCETEPVSCHCLYILLNDLKKCMCVCLHFGSSGPVFTDAKSDVQNSLSICVLFWYQSMKISFSYCLFSSGIKDDRCMETSTVYFHCFALSLVNTNGFLISLISLNFNSQIVRCHYVTCDKTALKEEQQLVISSKSWKN